MQCNYPGAGGDDFATFACPPFGPLSLQFHKSCGWRGQAHGSFRESPNAGNPSGPRASPAATAFPVLCARVPTAYLTMKVLLRQHLPSGICAHDVRLITL
jgi:hypothetical protein